MIVCCRCSPVSQGIGQLLGSLIFGRLADVVGRRPVILASLSATVLGAALCSVVPEHADTVMGVPCYALLMLALGLLGFGFGGSLSPLCILLAEVLPVHRRGFFLANATVAFQVGSVIITGAAWYILPRSLYVDDDHSASSAAALTDHGSFAILGFTGWRLLYAMEGIVAFLCVLLLCVILPESPRFLLLRNRAADAEQLREQLDTMLRMGGLQLQPAAVAQTVALPTAQQPLLSPTTDNVDNVINSSVDAAGVASLDDLIAALTAEVATDSKISAETNGTTGGWRVLLQGDLAKTTLLTTTIWGCFQFSNGFSERPRPVYRASSLSCSAFSFRPRAFISALVLHCKE